MHTRAKPETATHTSLTTLPGESGLKTKQVVARGTDSDELAVRAAVVLAGYEPV